MIWRLYIDYRALNKITVKNRCSIPCINDLIYKINGCNFFSKVDMNSRYHHIPNEKTNVWKKIIKYKEEIFEWLVMPFSLTSASTNFMRMWLVMPFNYMHVSSSGDPVETKVKAMLTINCVISRFPSCNQTSIGFPMILALFRKIKIPK